MGSPFRRSSGAGAQLSHNDIADTITNEQSKAAGINSSDDFGGSFDDDFNSADSSSELPAAMPLRRQHTASPRRHFSMPEEASSAQPEASSAPKKTAAMPAANELDDDISDFDSDIHSQSSVRPSQRHYEIMSVENRSFLDKLKSKISEKLNGSTPDDGVDYYTPPEGFASQRIRYRRSNRRPFPIWVKSALLGVMIVFAIYVLVKLIFFGMMIGRTNFVDDSAHASVRLTLDESAAMQAQL